MIRTRRFLIQRRFTYFAFQTHRSARETPEMMQTSPRPSDWNVKRAIRSPVQSSGRSKAAQMCQTTPSLAKSHAEGMKRCTFRCLKGW